MEIDHIGYAVKNIKKALPAFQALGFEFAEEICDDLRKINLCFGQKDGYVIELVSPAYKGVPSPVDDVLKKNGATPYQFCYRTTQQLDDEIKALEASGFKVLIPPMSATAFGDKRVVFMYHIAVGLIEIVES